MSRKVIEYNLEYNFPTIEAAVQKLKNALTTFKGRGYKAVIVIHGYGSTGVGGGIKTAVGKCLAESSMRGIVRAFASGEQWSVRKREMVSLCRSLEDYEVRLGNNPGVTVVILR